ncbi:unnamed protein product [Miscanthus lutarioriparius]|uniref:DUF4220 domain-containing protein n=1 Tax=Miscanthus lutarioriparius TaxID=422564 RepID=A0A811PL05_9POAL|nr:unnamed protein product [Miscanthus lutarioriparius]
MARWDTVNPRGWAWLLSVLFTVEDHLTNVFDDRLTTLKSFWLLREETTYKALRVGLSKTFNLIYSKDVQVDDKNRTTPHCGNVFSSLLWFLNLLLPIVPICLFHSSHKKAYRGTDIKVTFILLYITYFLEILSFFTNALLLEEWSDGVVQRSLVGLLAWNRRHKRPKFFQCKGLLDTYFGFKPCRSSKDITMLVREHVMAGWMSHMTDIESYWRFSDSQGQWALERNGGEEILGWSIEKPFDESIILWHVATEFFFHMKGTSHDFECARMCRQISNYMMHLLFANPEMLLPGSRRNLFTDAYDELEAILQGDDLSLLDERGLTLRIINKAELPEGFLRDSWVLAQELMQLGVHAKSLGSGGESLSIVSLLMSHAVLETYAERQQRLQLRLPKEERVNIAKQRIQGAAKNQATGGSSTPQGMMWEVIKDVCIEMLCFSAGRCRGYLHAKSLGSGGEFLSYISLLMSHAGLETYAERQQRVQLRLPKEERAKIAEEAANKQATPVREEENATTPLASQVDGQLVKQQEDAASTSASRVECVAPAPVIKLAQGLMQRPADGGADDDGKKMWKVIKGVWVKMLCFSAGRCRGFLHAKNLAYGGEYLAYVALLMSNAGLETSADRQQRMPLGLSKEERLQRAKRTAAGAAVVIEEENSAATPSTASAQGECTTAPALEVVVAEAV